MVIGDIVRVLGSVIWSVLGLYANANEMVNVSAVSMLLKRGFYGVMCLLIVWECWLV